MECVLCGGKGALLTELGEHLLRFFKDRTAVTSRVGY